MVDILVRVLPKTGDKDLGIGVYLGAKPKKQEGGCRQSEIGSKASQSKNALPKVHL